MPCTVRPFGFQAFGFCGDATARRTSGQSQGQRNVENLNLSRFSCSEYGGGSTFRVRLLLAHSGMVQ